MKTPNIGDEFGRYQILGELGRGGMGVVLRVRQLDLDREVALKLLPAELADRDEFVARFRHEASTLAAVDSPHIIAIFEHGEHDGHLFIATQLVRGGDLAGHLRESGPMSLDDALAVTAQLASALADAHDAGVLHRDVKPGNVLMRRVDSGWHTYLCDFGIAHTGQQELTSAGVVVGTFSYLAPERCEGEPATASSDIYALGCLLVALLTGSAPYAGSDFQVAHQHVSAPIPHWDETFVGATELNHILTRSMAKRPEDRYTSARDMRRDLLALSEMVRSGRTTPPAPAERTVLRPQSVLPATVPAQDSAPAGHRAAGRTLGVIAVAALLLTVLGLGGYFALRSNGANRTAVSTTKTPDASPTPRSAIAAPRGTARAAGATVTVTASPSGSPQANLAHFQRLDLPCSDGGFIVVLGSSFSPGTTASEYDSVLQRFDSDTHPARYAMTADSCPNLGAITGAGIGARIPYLGPFDDAHTACQARQEIADGTTYIAGVDDGTEKVNCACSFDDADLLRLGPDGPTDERTRMWVTGLQAMLNIFDHRNIQTTGYYANVTTARVEALQKKYNLPETGVMDPESWMRLKQEACP